MSSDKKTIFQELLKWSPIPFFGLDDNLIYTFVNIEAAKLVNKTIDELTGKKITDLFPGIEETIFGSTYIRVLKTNKVETVIDGFTFPDGGKGWYEVKVVPYTQGILCIATNITERKKIEEKYRNLSVELETILDIIPGMLFCKDKNDVVTRVNQNFANFLKLKKDDIIGKTSFDLFPADQAEKFRKDDLEVLTSGKPKLNIEESADSPNGKIFALSNKVPNFNENGEIFGMIGLAIDITKRKNIEEELKESEEKYRSLFENMTAGFAYHEVIVDENNKPIDYKYIEANPAFEKLTGLKVDEIIGKKVTQILPGIENDPADWIGKFGNVGITGIPLTVEDYSEPIDKWYKVSGYSPKKGYFAVTFTDITERKKAEEKLKESEEKFRTITEQSFMAIIIMQDYKIVYANETLQTLTEYSIQEMLNWSETDLFKMIHPDDIDIAIKRNKELFDGKITDYMPHSYRLITKSGKIKWIEVFSRLLQFQGKPTIFSTLIDITEKKKAEGKLKKSEIRYREAYERAEFYKDLFAHDISNILQNIQSSIGILSVCQNKPEKVDDVNEVMKIANDQIVRGSKLVSNIRTLSQISETIGLSEPIEIIQILNDAINFIHKSFPERDINIEIDSQIREIFVQANHLLLDVFENILINAIKYNKNPKIEVLTKISKEIKNGNKYVKIEFVDNGIGVPDIMKERIFGGIAPRKNKVHGMGLGLLLVKSIIININGHIWVEDKIENDSSKGSNFIILIPEGK